MGYSLTQMMCLLRKVPYELGSNFRVGIGAEWYAKPYEVVTQLIRIDEGAVVGKCNDRIIDG